MTDGTVDLLAIGAHPDDAELLCGGTLARMSRAGYRTGILDLTRGETGTRGSAELRRREAEKAAQVLGVAVRANAGLPDARLLNNHDSRVAVVRALRQLRPRTVILPGAGGRHPDHRQASHLARDACFLAGLKNFPEKGDGDGVPAGACRPRKVLYALSFLEHVEKPTFVVPIPGDCFRLKLQAVSCYASQFSGVVQAGDIFPDGRPLMDRIETANRHYGSLVRAEFGEPFITEETMAADDVVALPVDSF